MMGSPSLLGSGEGDKPQVRWLRPQMRLLTIPEAGSSRSRCGQGWCCLGPLSRHADATFSLCPRVSLPSVVSAMSSSYKDAGHVGPGPTPGPILTESPCKAHRQHLGSWGLGLHHMNVKQAQLSPNSSLKMTKTPK